MGTSATQVRPGAPPGRLSHDRLGHPEAWERCLAKGQSPAVGNDDRGTPAGSTATSGGTTTEESHLGG
jgi:hypothetical protein